MPQAVRRGDEILVDITATAAGEPRDLSGVEIFAAARFEGNTTQTVGRVTVDRPTSGEFTARFVAPLHRVGRLLIDVEYREQGIVNSSPTIEVDVIESAVETRIDKVRTQYRESPNLLHLMRSCLRRVDGLIAEAIGYPSHFTLSAAAGDQLTMIGRRLGWPRCHCICDAKPVFGFACGDERGVAGFCDPNATWAACGETGLSEFCITDDETYRTFLRIRIYQTLGLFDLDSLEEAVRLIWPDGWIADARNGAVTIAPNADGIDERDPLLQLWPRVLPIAVGVRAYYHFDTRPVFGFGEGWAGFAECAATDVLTTESGEAITTEDGEAIAADFPPISDVSDWLCRIDPTPC